MKVNNSGSLSIEEKLKAKFGNRFEKAKVKNKRKTDSQKISNKAKNKSKKTDKSDKAFAGDIKDNSPNSVVTQEKLKSLLRSGGFQFNDQERAALSDILDV